MKGSAIKARCRPLVHTALDLVTFRRGLPRKVAGHRWRLAPACWRAFPPGYEQNLVAVLKALLEPGMVAIDIGAHVGVHALTLARLVGSHGKVIAFEPAAASFELLRRHIRMNGMTSRIEALHAAVGDRDGSRVLVTDPLGADPGNSFVDRHYLARKRHEIVEVVTLDTFCSRRRLLPALVKIDVEGYEARVLDGARQVLSQRPAPTIVCAVHPWHLEQLGESEAAFFALADELRLTPWTLAREPAVPTGEYREVLLIPQ